MLNIHRNIQSLTKFKENTPEFVSQLKETGEPIILTINGKAELIVQDAKSYQKLMERAEEAKTLEGIRKGLEDMKAGRGRPADEVLAEIGREFGLDPNA